MSNSEAISLAPCWYCGAPKGHPCRSRRGEETSPLHQSRKAIWRALTLKGDWNQGWPPSWEHVIAPRVQQRVAYRADPKLGLNVGDSYFYWEPVGVKPIRSKIRPVVDSTGVLFWPEGG